MQHSIQSNTTWKTPSNIAIVKYWGKRDVQEPVNPSISFSLSEATTTTKITASPSEKGGFTFLLDGKEQGSFDKKIRKFLELAQVRLPLIKDHFLKIESSNTFPHSTGIASSASAMSALAFCLADLQHQITPENPLDISEVSSVARLGSGSAARSVYGGWNLWGRLTEIPESSDHYAVPVPVSVNPVFQKFHDDILIVKSEKKPVSSSAGHALMNHHPYRNGRIKQAHDNTLNLIKYLETGNLEGFIEMAESEALSLHALMMSSTPSYTLLQPNSLLLIEKIREFRKTKDIPVSFTMDAGPNIHLLYPDEYQKEISGWQEKELQPLCEKSRIIRDNVGNGPQKIINS
ncbi:diphosphomevalonate decarboxylase [Marinilabilia salmonicolor]|jgi:diphosphomevalonate decarboxylase|uniref:diphosphomevalonate decarboxylase n=1 Tax=Marinilabilia salmonicolor TaxID=989 RepID=A0A368VDE1_9BACT|nr:diphosphomevalonate decarboxylase [Marinilabilia salmonicolor]RCW38310.1 diphosphomevalonate decarboxylase [Marinilabilia salmonicolor]